ncbi:hypothetical protein [Planctomycetes bacterium Pan216]|uniref:hypothetical protein n=1 Tax=Kolteria novifilia TaxID=2527975 RepID=UPI0011A862E9
MVWIAKIALFKSLNPPIPIREPITFTTGLNIVWGIEDESQDDHFEPGHGVGKTTLCRLIRYCLGEPNYGQAYASKEIQHTFPEGYVAAEVHIQGKRWAVLRPFTKTRADAAQQDISIEDLLEHPPPRASFHEYLDHLSSTCLSGLRTDSVLMNGDSIEWHHALAMCARDQEARYQSMWQWRSPRSDSGTPKIQKDDAFLILRSVLGLLPDEETSLQRDLDRMSREHAKVESTIAERRREPEYWTRHHRRALRQDFDISDALDASLDPDDMIGLPALVGNRIAQLEAEQAKRRRALADLDRTIELRAAALGEPSEMYNQTKAAADINESGTAVLLKSLNELRELKKQINELEEMLCKYGNVPIGECTHTRDHLTTIDEEISTKSSEYLPTAADRDQSLADLRAREKRLESQLAKSRMQLDDLNDQRRDLDDERRNTDRQIAEIRKTLRQLAYWDGLQSGTEPDAQLTSLQKTKTTLESDLEDAKQRLKELLASQNTALTGLRDVYDALVREVLSPDFHGRIALTSSGLSFRIFRGENLSGEAFETLSILMADVAVLVMGAMGTAAHPGLLLHDSPREADLGGHIYRRLLACVASLSKELGGNHTVPFQYIVTTTTAPPLGLRSKRTLRLKLGGAEGLLFGRQLHADHATTEPAILFEEQEP